MRQNHTPKLLAGSFRKDRAERGRERERNTHTRIHTAAHLPHGHLIIRCRLQFAHCCDQPLQHRACCSDTIHRDNRSVRIQKKREGNTSTTHSHTQHTAAVPVHASFTNWSTDSGYAANLDIATLDPNCEIYRSCPLGICCRRLQHGALSKRLSYEDEFNNRPATDRDVKICRWCTAWLVVA